MKRTDIPAHWVSALFKRFQARYLHKWTSAIEGIESIAVAEWSQKLNGLSGDQIKTGLDNWSNDWPPCADEFRDACLGRKVGLNEYGLDYVPEIYRVQSADDVPRLEKKPNPEIVKSSIEQMRKHLNGC